MEINQTAVRKVCLAWGIMNDWCMFGDLQCSFFVNWKSTSCLHAICLLCAKKIPQIFVVVFFPGNESLSTCVSDTLTLFSKHKFRNKRDGLFESPCLVWSIATALAVKVLLLLVFIRTLIAVLYGEIAMINPRLWYFWEGLLVGSYSEGCFKRLRCRPRGILSHSMRLGSYRREILRFRNVWSLNVLNGCLTERIND